MSDMTRRAFVFTMPRQLRSVEGEAQRVGRASQCGQDGGASGNDEQCLGRDGARGRQRERGTARPALGRPHHPTRPADPQGRGSEALRARPALAARPWLRRAEAEARGQEVFPQPRRSRSSQQIIPPRRALAIEAYKYAQWSWLKKRGRGINLQKSGGMRAGAEGTCDGEPPPRGGAGQPRPRGFPGCQRRRRGAEGVAGQTKGRSGGGRAHLLTEACTCLDPPKPRA